MTKAHAPEPGTVLAGKYRVEQVLGVGGMGAVVAAHHIHLDQKVAIKYLLPEAIQNPEVVERFAREARAAAKIRGEHVARVIDVGQFDDGAPFMVMEYLEGQDLAQLLAANGPLPFEDAARYLLEACEALAEAHAAKIVHRDLKPSNLFLALQPDKRSIVKVLDFGISKIGDAPSAALTKTSALMGTAFYMSPEQLLSSKNVDHRSDIWSLGVILYELLGGQPPFLGESVPEIIGGILTNEPEPLRTHRPDVPPGLEAVIERCMKSKAGDRYAHVAAFASALAPFASSRDRMSVEITARVLGEAFDRVPSLRPAQRGTSAGAASQEGGSTIVLPQTSPSGTPPASASAPAGPTTQAVQAGDRLAAVPVGVSTNVGVTSSAISSIAPKRSSLPLVAGVGVALLLAAGVGVFAMKRGSGDPAPATGLITPSAVASALPTPHAAPDPLPAIATPSATPVVAPATPPATFAVGTGAAVPATNIAHTTKPATKPTASAATATPPSAPTPPVPTTPPAPSATATAAASASKNPLQMGIK